MNLEIRNTGTATLHMNRRWFECILSFCIPILNNIYYHFMKDNQYYASQYQYNATATLNLLAVHLTRDWENQPSVRSSATELQSRWGCSRFCRQKNRPQNIHAICGISTTLGFFACNQRLTHPITTVEEVQYTAHNWIIGVIGVTQTQNDFRKRVTTFVL